MSVKTDRKCPKCLGILEKRHWGLDVASHFEMDLFSCENLKDKKCDFWEEVSCNCKQEEKKNGLAS